MYLGLLILVFLVAGMVRCYPRLVLTNVYFSDTMFHLFYIREIRANKHIIPKYLDRYLRTNRNVYPFIYHWLLSFFSEKMLLKFERFNGAFFDLLNALILLLFLNYSQSIQLIKLTEFEEFNIITMFLFCPLFLRLGSGPRAYNGSPRIFGQTLYLIHAVTFLLFINTNSIIFFFCALISVGLVSISSIFAMQVVLFFGILFSIFYPIYLVIIGGAILFFLLITFGRSWMVMRGAFMHSHNYVKKQKKYLYPTYRSYKKLFYQYFNYLVELKNQKISIAKLFKIVLSDNHYIFILLLTVYVPFGIYSVIRSSHNSDFNVILILWIICAVFMFLLTKHKPFLFLGEGERYLEYSVFPFIYFFVLNSNFPHWLYIAIDVYFILLAIYFSRRYVLDYRSMNKDNTKTSLIMKEIDNLREGMVMPIPNYHGKSILFHTRNTRVMVPYLMFDNTVFKKEEYEFIFGDNFEYPNSNLDKLITHYNVKYILSTPKELSHYVNNLLNKEVVFSSLFELVSEDSNYCLYKVKL